LVSPVTLHVVAGVAGGVDVVVQVFEPVDDVTVYLEMPAPPLLAGAVQLTSAVPLPTDPPTVAVTFVGAPGTVEGVAVAEPDAAPVPLTLVAVTVKL
jgi:hypothetical protein